MIRFVSLIYSGILGHNLEIAHNSLLHVHITHYTVAQLLPPTITIRSAL